jgi:hypothetical protein
MSKRLSTKKLNIMSKKIKKDKKIKKYRQQGG